MSDNDKTSEIVFDKTLDITKVFDFHKQLNEHLNDKKEILLNAEQIEKIDGAGMQLILAFIISAEKLNLQVSWSGTSDAFNESAKILGVTKSLMFNT